MKKNDNWAGIILILVGIAFLLSNLDLVDIGDFFRFWPLILIAVGARMLMQNRGAGSGPATGPPPPPA